MRLSNKILIESIRQELFKKLGKKVLITDYAIINISLSLELERLKGGHKDNEGTK